ncbi:MAG: hypothetical protein MUF87_19155 [Anaerolineae bacterium]|jgi:hypothetical protein|nr:hypothetical protein [Anaerolineae bacterium]
MTHFKRHLISVAFLLMMTGCDTLVSPYLQRVNAISLFEVARSFLEINGDQERVSLYCQVGEGSGCHLTTRTLLDTWDGLTYHPVIEDLANRIDPTLAQGIMSDIGFENILDAGRSGIKLSCERSIGQLEVITCQIDYNNGGGWQKLPVGMAILS